MLDDGKSDSINLFGHRMLHLQTGIQRGQRQQRFAGTALLAGRQVHANVQLLVEDLGSARTQRIEARPQRQLRPVAVEPLGQAPGGETLFEGRSTE